MTVGDQMTGEALRDGIASYETAFASVPEPMLYPAITLVGGGTTRATGSGAIEVAPFPVMVPSLTRAEPLPVVSLVVDPMGWSKFTIETTPARLVELDGVAQVQGLPSKGLLSRHHIQKDAGGVRRLRFAVASNPFHAIIKPLIEEDSPVRYEIPPCATAIRGTGTLRYTSGHELTIDGYHLLYRPNATGGLSLREGGIYADFLSDTAPEIRIGTLWLSL